jgi:hypothetical protein
MPLITTIGASTRRGFDFFIPPDNAPVLWYDNGVLAQGAAYNLQGDGKYYTYNQGLNTGTYTGPWYSVNGDNLWRRIIYGHDMHLYLVAMGPAPTDALVYVNGYFNLDGQGSKWYYNGAVANGYIQNLNQYGIFIVEQEYFIETPTSTLNNWHYFTNGVDDGLISGEHNIDNQGNLWYTDGQLASTPYGFGLQITSDNLWHRFDAGVDLGLVNAGVDPSDTQGVIDYFGGTYLNPLLVFNGLPFTGKYYATLTQFSALFRAKINSDFNNIIQMASAFEFVDGVPVSILSGEHAPANMDKDNNGQPVVAFWKDGAWMINVIRYEGSEVVYYGSYIENASRTVITGSEIYYGFFPSYENMLLPINSSAPLFKHYLIIDGAMTTAGCFEWVGQYSNQYFCLGNYGELQGTASDSSCSDCTAAQNFYLN